MNNRTVTTSIDPEKCIGCGLCVKVCPAETITMQDDKAVVSGDRSLQCGHCAGVCPVDAVTVKAIDEQSLIFCNFDLPNRWLSHGESDTSLLVRLMASRRSCRNFRDDTVEHSLLEDLVKIGTLAPSGSNCQNWTFTVLPDRTAVNAFGQRIGTFFRHINRMAEKWYMRWILKKLGKPQLDDYYREHYQSVQEALEDWERHGRDRLFHGAPALIVVGSKEGGSCPAEDALLATQNILLGAHSLGLGTCLIGYAVEAMHNDRSIQRFLKIPDEEKIYAVIALGYPDETYHTLTGRKKVVTRVFTI